ncbi:hypothetical protein H7J87_15315 [Mycolicibacterium wolinskyi]|uniref:hypothetical protein n=1 Tax=Mycolicibacterium TaxID=1866885 RepID=UPI0013FE1E50|nr:MULTISPECIES: hypothetical protein [Mycolicibacterium]MCV7286696.1 hypothetical protein [Mycolicibacterium wolinskyi]MCV7293676.1 hypothetical protein [Mycolicibacterium goodii]
MSDAQALIGMVVFFTFIGAIASACSDAIDLPLKLGVAGIAMSLIPLAILVSPH